MKRLLIAGCGDLGIRLAGNLEPALWQVTGLRRSTDHLPPSIRPFQADLLDPVSLKALPDHFDAVIYQATPGERSPSGYRRAYIQGLANLLAVVDFERLIFVSSTAVFGQDDGDWVDEDSVTEPSAFNGQILLEAEQLACKAGGLVVRFSGIYGPGRDYLIRQVQSGQARCRPRPVQWTNRIHADDCAGILAHLLTLPEPREIYCASDCKPVERCVVLDWLAEQLGAPQPGRSEDHGVGQGKRVSNRRLLDSGYQFLYPDFMLGYGGLLK
jgi:nucleoside-diphosphate-sugar epimerase